MPIFDRFDHLAWHGRRFLPINCVWKNGEMKNWSIVSTITILALFAEVVITELFIQRPRHHSVVRTQSVQIELDSNEHVEKSTIELDGKLVFETEEERISLILADEQGMTEGVHNITWWNNKSNKVIVKLKNLVVLCSDIFDTNNNAMNQFF
jgi:hypothetical protein